MNFTICDHTKQKGEAEVIQAPMGINVIDGNLTYNITIDESDHAIIIRKVSTGAELDGMIIFPLSSNSVQIQ